MSSRDPQFEREFLDHAARQAGLSGLPAQQFYDRVMARLRKGAEEYGGDDAFWEPANGDPSGTPKTIREAREEAEDIGGWCLGAAQTIMTDQRNGLIDDDSAHQMKLHLIAAVSQGLAAWVHLDTAADIYRERVKR
jgi:hypothetical protein